MVANSRALQFTFRDESATSGRAESASCLRDCHGFAAGLKGRDALNDDKSLANYSYFHAACADFLRRLERTADVLLAYERALARTHRRRRRTTFF
ncbi:MAG: hypothetical protein GY822_17500 [Deltaproteobacteria bacterium]|nr:hypothetical protein [Deltaproteobacteria bacterium]